MEIREKRNVNVNARQLVAIAQKSGYTLESIAEICGVSAGSVKRWLHTGRADAEKIKPLEQAVGQTYLQPDAVGEILIDIYTTRNKRYRLKRGSLKHIAGRSTLRSAFVDQLIQYLLDKGYFMLEAVDGDEEFFVIIRIGQVLKHVKDFLTREDISAYYHEVADSITEDDD